MNTHEYPECLECATSRTASLPSTLWHTARTEGARSADPEKYLKDAVLLQKEYDEGSGSIPTRTVFYLAQSYRDAGRGELAQRYYEKRVAIEPRGWLEEVYVACVNLARLATDIGLKLRWTWQAQEVVPARRDAVFELLTYARKRDLFCQEIFALDVAFATPAAKESTSTGHLFLPVLESWQYDDELSIIAHYTGHFAETITFAGRALLTCPVESQTRIEKNISWWQMKIRV